MPKFYFTVQDTLGGATDAEGADLEGVEAALVHAALGARSIMCEGLMKGRLDLSGYIEIEDQYRVVVARLPFSEAIDIVTEPPSW